MVWTIYSDGHLIHTSQVGYGTEGYFVKSPKIKKTQNEADSLSFSIPFTNINYDKISILGSTITVLKTSSKGETKCIFLGRPTSETVNNDLSKNIECEGAYAFLNDVIIPKQTFYDYTPGRMFNKLEEYYNKKQEYNKARKIGLSYDHLSTASQNFKYNFNTMKNAFENLMSGRKMHMYQYNTKDSSLPSGYYPHIRYKEDYNEAKENGPMILFGENLVDYTRSMNMKRYATAVLPLGKTNKKWPFGYVDIAGDIVKGESKEKRAERMVYVTKNEEALNKYGLIEVVKYWRGQKSSESLLKKAKRWLEKTQFEDLSFSITAVDIYDLNTKNGIEEYQASNDEIEILDRVRVISPPHALDTYLAVTSIEYDLENPGDTSYTFGNRTAFVEPDD